MSGVISTYSTGNDYLLNWVDSLPETHNINVHIIISDRHHLNACLLLSLQVMYMYHHRLLQSSVCLDSV